MCIRHYKAHALCKHEDKNGTPTHPALELCPALTAGWPCTGIIEHAISPPNSTTAAFCSTCHAAVQALLAAIGALEIDSAAADAFYRRVKWDRTQTRELARLIYELDQAVQVEMRDWYGAEHTRHLIFYRRAELFGVFKAWVLDQRDKERIENEGVVPLLTRWMCEKVEQLITKKMDDFSPRDFRSLLQRAFIPWIQQWPLDFGGGNNHLYLPPQQQQQQQQQGMVEQQGDPSWSAAREKFTNDWRQAKEQLFPVREMTAMELSEMGAMGVMSGGGEVQFQVVGNMNMNTNMNMNMHVNGNGNGNENTDNMTFWGFGNMGA